MTISKDFWKTKKLNEMSLEEWESLCDGCGICCLYKVEDEDTGEVELTNVACRFLDLDIIHCQLYQSRQQAMPTCIQLTPSKVRNLHWLPETCAYRLIMDGKPLPDWHPLMSSDPESVHNAGISVKGKVMGESDANLDHIEDYMIEELYDQQPD
jgi:uncharacterized cysteine cluster protein YcgN (CxxCxxCC family)